jgi:Tol biopolymer transport system component
MRRSRFLPVLVLLALLLLSAGIATVAGRQVTPFLDKQENEAFTLRAKTIGSTLSRNDLFDCSTYVPDTHPLLPIEQQIFHVVRDIKVTPDDGKDYLGAVWSPSGDAMVFVAPTGDHRDILNSDALPSDEDTQLVAISKNELVLYFPDRNTWKQITSDGARPTWSTDARSIYYMAGTDLMKFDISTQAATYTGLRAPNTGVGLLVSRPLSDGRLLAPRQPHAPLEVQGGEMPAWGPIEVAVSDYVLLSPQGDQIVVAYGANTWKGQFVPALTVIYHPNGEVTPLLKNCQASAIEMVWSPDRNRVAYPVRAQRSEIRIYDVRSGQTQVLVRLDTPDLLSGLSWSPDSRYLAFTLGDDRVTPRSIWLVSTDGTTRQRLMAGGLLPNWSPDGEHILYARPGTTRLLDWYLLELSPAIQIEGEQRK